MPKGYRRALQRCTTFTAWYNIRLPEQRTAFRTRLVSSGIVPDSDTHAPKQFYACRPTPNDLDKCLFGYALRSHNSNRSSTPPIPAIEPPSSASLKSSEELEAINSLISLHSASTSSKKRAAPSSTGDSEEPSSKKANALASLGIVPIQTPVPSNNSMFVTSQPILANVFLDIPPEPATDLQPPLPVTEPLTNGDPSKISE